MKKRISLLVALVMVLLTVAAAFPALAEKTVYTGPVDAFFGYSLGAPGALETACYYSAHPEYGVKIKNICIGGGAFYPDLSLRQTVYNGEITYLIYPGIAVGLDYWMDLHLDYSKLLWGEVLDNLDMVSDGMTNMRDLAKRYGFRVQQYLHPDVFLPETNEEINRLLDALASL